MQQLLPASSAGTGGAGWPLGPDENVLASLEVDLDAALRFARGELLLTHRRLLAREAGSDQLSGGAGSDPPDRAAA